MTKKEFFTTFFSNGLWAFKWWFVFNFVFGIAYFMISIGIQDFVSYAESQTRPILYEFLIPYVVVYIVMLIPCFVVGLSKIKGTGNIVLDFVSLLPIRFLTVVFSIWMANYHNYYVFSNSSLAVLEALLNRIIFAHRVYPSYDFEPVWYYITSLIPFVMTFIGFQFGKRRKKKATKE